jgi:hypothetical protein
MKRSLMVIAILVASCGVAGAGGWEPVSDPAEIEQLYSGARLIGTSGKIKWVAEYSADGTGVEWAWGVKFYRTWTIRNDQVCITSEDGSAPQCITVEHNTDDPELYRAISVTTGEFYEFRKSNQPARGAQGSAYAPPPTAPEKQAEGDGGPSAAEMAKKLANPSLAIGQMETNFVFNSFGGELPDAGDQQDFQFQFQPVIPFPIGEGGKSLMFRPLFPLFFDKPVFDTTSGSFEAAGFGLGDIFLDAIYGGTSESGFLLSYGAAVTFPTATSGNLGGDQWLLGPELVLGKVFDWGIVGALFNHQWDVAGGDGVATSITGGQYFYGINIGGGTFITAGLPWSYNHNAESGNKWTFPIGFGISKTVILGGKVLKFGTQYWYYVATPDGFGPRSQIRFTVNPVVELPWGKKDN